MQRVNGREKSKLDAAVVDPSGDLLGVDPHAEALANYINANTERLPITIGIQGEWGEGKTTLVNLVCYHLSHPKEPGGQARPIKFVSFSAWPYTTSEKLWRALILKIARVLYGKDKSGCPWQIAEQERAAAEAQQQQQPPPPQPPQPPQQQQAQPQQQGEPPAARDGAGGDIGERSGGVIPTLSRFLSNSAFTLSAPPRTKFEEVVEELEKTNFGQVSRRKADVQLNEDATMAAVVKGAVAALSTVSPLAAGLRALFGLDPKEDAERAVQGGVARGGVDPLEGFRNTFSKLIGERVPKGEPLYVFIDDLDRAQPDVALDIMEAIRIAFENDRCVFILAVDDRLIAEGLWLRYRNLYEQEDKKEQRARFAVKGREYLEKIIQFRMLMPPRTPEQVQKLIAARHPELAASGDIIREVATANPRRVKQYCEHMLFQKMVEQEAAED